MTIADCKTKRCRFGYRWQTLLRDRREKGNESKRIELNRTEVNGSKRKRNAKQRIVPSLLLPITNKGGD